MDAVQSPRLTINASSLLHGASDAVEQTFSLQKRRSGGIFLTPPSLAAELAKNVAVNISRGAPVLDPAMGCGDLLLACASLSPIERSLSRTLKSWSNMMWGFEANPKLVTVSKLRLALLGRILHPVQRGLSQHEVEALFPAFMCGDFLATDLSSLPLGICVIGNPPFSVSATLPSSIRRQGKVSAAAAFLEKVCRESPELSQIAMLLPEVLRCGTSYRNLRSEVLQYVRVIKESSLPRRDCWSDVDVDVFVGVYTRVSEAEVLRGQVSASADKVGSKRGTRLDEVADLRVGPVIPYRTPKKGGWRRYITAKSVPAWNTGFEPYESRRFEGYLSEPPFVVVRRTSRPDRAYRAVGSVVIGSSPVAVENHLIVVKPRDGRLSTCRDVVLALKDEAVNRQLNESMRCRHLTVASLAAVRVNI